MSTDTNHNGEEEFLQSWWSRSCTDHGPRPESPMMMIMCAAQTISHMNIENWKLELRPPLKETPCKNTPLATFLRLRSLGV